MEAAAATSVASRHTNDTPLSGAHTDVPQRHPDDQEDHFVERLLATGRKHERVKRMGSISNEDGSKITVTWRDQGLTAAVSMEFHSRSGDLVDTVDVPLDSLPRFFDAFFIGTEPVSSRARFAEQWGKVHRRISAEEYRRDPEAFWEYPWRNHRLRRHRGMERWWSSLPPRQVRRWNVVLGRVLRELDRWSKSIETLNAAVDADGTPSTDAVLAQAKDGHPHALLLLDILLTHRCPMMRIPRRSPGIGQERPARRIADR